MALIDFTLSNARRFYSSVGNPLGVKGLTTWKAKNYGLGCCFGLLVGFGQGTFKYFLYSSSQVILTLSLTVREPFMMVIEVSMLIISCNPGRIWTTQKFIHCLKTIVDIPLCIPVTQTEVQCTLSSVP